MITEYSIILKKKLNMKLKDFKKSSLEKNLKKINF